MRLLAFPLLALSLAATAAAQSPTVQPTSVVLRLTPAAAEQMAVAVQAARLPGPTPDVSSQLQAVPALAQAAQSAGATEMRRVFRTDPRHAARHRAAGLDRWYVAEVPAAEVEAAVSRFARVDAVEVAEVNQVVRLEGTAVPVGDPRPSTTDGKDPKRGPKGGPVIPDDPRFDEQWHYHNTGQTGGTPNADINLPEAWETEMGSSAVIVNVNDSGVDLDHPDLAGALWINAGEIPDNGIDDDENGYVDDVHGWSFIQNSANVDDASGHGTHVSGTIGAVTNNGVGVAGIAGGTGLADGVRILSTQWTLGDTGSGEDISAGMIYAADNGAVISNNSHTLGRSLSDLWVTVAEYFAANAGGPGQALAGGLIVASGGNDGVDRPVAYETPLIVASTGQTDEKAWYSAYGDAIDVSAPGGETNTVAQQGVLSTLPGGTYGFYQGTSMAAPHAAGVAALYASANFGADAGAVRVAMETFVDPLPDEALFAQGKMGAGRLNAETVLTGIAPVASVSAETVLVEIESGATATAMVSVANVGPEESVDLSFSVEVSAFAADQGALVDSYAASDSDDDDGPAVAFEDLTGSGSALSLSDDDSETVTLPFSFSFFDTAQTEVIVSSNGFLAFGGNANEYDNTGIPREGGPRGMIAPFWDDLDPSSGGQVLVQDMEDGRWIAQWTNVRRYSERTNPSRGNTFQVVLSADGLIEFQYGEMNGVLDNATVGVERPDEALAVQVALNESYLTPEMAVRLTPNEELAMGKTWASAAVSALSVGVGESESVVLTFDAVLMDPGTYAGTLTVRTNDPLQLRTVVPLELVVVDATAAEEASQDAAWALVAGPNPSRGAVTLRYELPQSGPERLAVYDVLGREVAVLREGVQAAGPQQAEIEAGLAPGVYFVRLVASGRTLTQTITIAR